MVKFKFISGDSIYIRKDKIEAVYEDKLINEDKTYKVVTIQVGGRQYNVYNSLEKVLKEIGYTE